MAAKDVAGEQPPLHPDKIEEWRDFEAAPRPTMLSSQGRIWNVATATILKPTVRRNRLLAVLRTGVGDEVKSFALAQSVLRTFKPNETGKYVRHLDGDLLNCSVDNLVWHYPVKVVRISREERRVRRDAERAAKPPRKAVRNAEKSLRPPKPPRSPKPPTRPKKAAERAPGMLLELDTKDAEESGFYLDRFPMVWSPPPKQKPVEPVFATAEARILDKLARGVSITDLAQMFDTTPQAIKRIAAKQ